MKTIYKNGKSKKKCIREIRKHYQITMMGNPTDWIEIIKELMGEYVVINFCDFEIEIKRIK